MNKRLQKFSVSKYVAYNAETKKSKCLMADCNKELSGKRPANIKRHYFLMHKITINDIEENEPLMQTQERNKTKRKLYSKLNKSEFTKCCADIVTMCSIPFRVFSSKCFKQIIEPYEDTFNLKINERSMAVIIDSAANNLRQVLKKRFASKMISIKVDIASRLERSVMGINAQYIIDNKINISTIGMIDLSKRHTSQFLKDEILKCLRNYDIELKQLYSITTDNGANVLKMSKLLQDMQQEITDINGDFENGDLEDDRTENDIQSEVATVFSVVRCAVHTLQLAATDVLKTIDAEVSDCRSLAKKLRVHIRAKELFIHMPVLDVPTRWNSSFEMISSLISAKESLRNCDLIALTDFNWSFAERFVSAFKPVYDCTMHLQKEQYVIGDFYRDWLDTELHLEVLGRENSLAFSIFEAMSRRKIKLMENAAFSAGIYVDPRFNYQNSPLISDYQKKIALTHLLQTYAVLKELAHKDAEEVEGHSVSNPTLPVASRYSMLTNRRRDMMATQPTAIINNLSIKAKLKSICEMEASPFEIDVLEYWKNRGVDEDIKNLIFVVLAVPATQVSVERAFSALALVLTKLRTNMCNKTLENILIRLNSALIKSIDTEKIYN